MATNKAGYASAALVRARNGEIIVCLLVNTGFPKNYRETLIILKLAPDCCYCKELNSPAQGSQNHGNNLCTLTPPIFYVLNNIVIFSIVKRVERIIESIIIFLKELRTFKIKT